MKYRRQMIRLTVALSIASIPVAWTQQQDTAAAVTQKPRHLKSKDDINAIGSRKISGSRFGDTYSLEHEAKMGEEYSQEIEHGAELIRDPIITEYVSRIGQNLVRNSDAKVPFTIKVIASDEINAFALPGGFLYVNSGMILAVEDEAELAAVMAHEIAHVAARHATRQMTRSDIFNVASFPLVFVSGGAGLILQEALNVATPLGVTKFSRSFESEADYLGVQYMYKAGYDPEALITFFERVQATQGKRPGFMAKAFSTHPQTLDRIRKVQKEIARILPPRDSYVVSTSEFDEVKSRLYTMQNGRRRVQGVGPNLKRGPAANTKDSDFY